MSRPVYPPLVIVRTIVDSFFRYRGMASAPRGLDARLPVEVLSDDDVVRDMAKFDYVRIDATLVRPPSAHQNWVVFLVLSGEGKYAHHGPDLRRLLETVEGEHAAREGHLAEIIIVAEEGFFAKKNLTDVVDSVRTRTNVVARPYSMFALVVPEHVSVPRHRVMGAEEVAALLQRQRCEQRDLPVIRADDPPVVWIGGAEGQVVEILRDSHTAGIAYYYRRIV